MPPSISEALPLAAGIGVSRVLPFTLDGFGSSSAVGELTPRNRGIPPATRRHRHHALLPSAPSESDGRGTRLAREGGIVLVAGAAVGAALGPMPKLTLEPGLSARILQTR
jgi:hypothetical protein